MNLSKSPLHPLCILAAGLMLQLNGYPVQAVAAPKANSLLLDANHQAAIQNYSAAESSYVKYLSGNSDDANAHHMYGRVLALMGRYEDALKQYKLALKLDPNDGGILTDVGVTLTVVGQGVLGARFLHQSCVVAPKSVLALNNMGAALMKLHDYAQAAQFFSRSLEIQARNARIKELHALAISQLANSKAYDFGDNVSWKDIPDAIDHAAVELARAKDAEQKEEETPKSGQPKKQAKSRDLLDEKPLFVELSVNGFEYAEVSGLGYVQSGESNEVADKVKEVKFTDTPSVELMGDVTIEFAGAGVVKFGKGTVYTDDPKSAFTINAGTGEVNCLSGDITVEHWNQITAARVYAKAQVTTNWCKKVYGMDDSKITADNCGDVNLVGHATGLIVNCDEVVLTDNATATVRKCTKLSVLSNANAKTSNCDQVVCLQNGKTEPAPEESSNDSADTEK